MRRERKIDNKGFSLVELIIVIAIMAILIGVMSPQLMKYVERARQSKDTQAVDSVHTAVVTAMLDPAVEDAPASKTYNKLSELYADTTASPNFVAAVKEIANESDASKIEENAFASKAYKTKPIKIEISGGKVKCTVASTDSTLYKDIIIE